MAHVLVTHRLGPVRSQLSLAKLSNISFSIAYTLDDSSGWVHHWRPSPATCRVGEGPSVLLPLSFGDAGPGLRWSSPRC